MKNNDIKKDDWVLYITPNTSGMYMKVYKVLRVFDLHIIVINENYSLINKLNVIKIEEKYIEMIELLYNRE